MSIQLGLPDEELYPDIKSVAVLCRGTSLKEINDMPVCAALILVNAFHDEIEIKDISRYVKKHNYIIHVTSAQSQSFGMYDRDLYRKYNFRKMVLPYIKECSPKYYQLRGEDPERCEGFNKLFLLEAGVSIPMEESWIYKVKDFNSIDKVIKDKDTGNTYINMFLPVENMSDRNKEDMIQTKRYPFTAPTCGMDSILYAVNDLNAKEVSIIGLDFYDGVGYLTNSFGAKPADTGTAIDRGEDTEMMKSFFYNFVNKHKDVNFNIITKSKIKTDIKNLNVQVV